jgi:antitoxin ParD1/3/4
MIGTWTAFSILGMFSLASGFLSTSATPSVNPMEIDLTPAQRAWLEAKVSKGEFASLEEAASAAITESMAMDIDDLEWAKPYVDRAREDLQRGDVLTLEEHRGRMAARLDGHKS